MVPLLCRKIGSLVFVYLCMSVKAIPEAISNESEAASNVCSSRCRWKTTAPDGLNFQGPGNKVQVTSTENWTPEWNYYGTYNSQTFDATLMGNPAEWFFGDLNGDGKSDALWYSKIDGNLTVWFNAYPAAEIGTILHSTTLPHGPLGKVAINNIWLADMNGDGFADLVAHDPTSGFFNVHLNTCLWPSETCLGFSSEALQPFKWEGSYWQEKMWMADLDGRGRSSFLVRNVTGDLMEYVANADLKGAVNAIGPINRTAMFPNSRHSDFDDPGDLEQETTESVPTSHFADLNGDGRADPVVYLITNRPDSDISWNGYLNIENHPDGQSFPFNVTNSLKFAGYNNDPWHVGHRLVDFDGDGRADHLQFRVVDDPPGRVAWDVYRLSSPSFNYVSEHMIFADVDGNGLEDLLALQTDNIVVWLNNGSNWNLQDFAKDLPTNCSLGWNPILADMNGDRHADLNLVDPVKGDMKTHFNSWDSLSTYLFNATCQATAETPYSANPLSAAGFSYHAEDKHKGIGVRLADLDGDGRADYIWLNKFGAVSAVLNERKQLEPNTIRYAKIIQTILPPLPTTYGIRPTNWTREDVFFADMDGDGKADYVVLEPDWNRLFVWINKSKNGSLSFTFDASMTSSKMSMTRQNSRLAILTNSSRADYVGIDPLKGSFNVLLNKCNCSGVPGLLLDSLNMPLQLGAEATGNPAIP